MLQEVDRRALNTQLAIPLHGMSHLLLIVQVILTEQWIWFYLIPTVSSHLFGSVFFFAKAIRSHMRKARKTTNLSEVHVNSNIRNNFFKGCG